MLAEPVCLNAYGIWSPMIRGRLSVILDSRVSFDYLSIGLPYDSWCSIGFQPLASRVELWMTLGVLRRRVTYSERHQSNSKAPNKHLSVLIRVALVCTSDVAIASLVSCFLNIVDGIFPLFAFLNLLLIFHLSITLLFLR